MLVLQEQVLAHLGLFSPAGTGPKYFAAVRALTALWLPVFVRRYALNATICTRALALKTGLACSSSKAGRSMAAVVVGASQHSHSTSC